MHSILADLPLMPSPPLAPFAPSDEQMRFMRLHALHFVTKWQWLMNCSWLRATTDRGFTATISESALDELVRERLVFRGVSCADVLLSDAGLELAGG